MRTLIAAALCFSALAQAEPCAKLDYAELDSLPKEQLLQMRCEYSRTALTPGLYGSYQGVALGNRCSAERARMDRLIARKYQLKNKGDEDLPYFVEINTMCRQYQY